MKRADRRHALLIDGDGQISSKTENKKRGFSSRTQYHRMMRMKSDTAKYYKEKLEDSRRMSYENTVAHIQLEKYKRWHLPDNPMEIIVEHFKEMVPDWFKENSYNNSLNYYTKKTNFVWKPLDLVGGMEQFSVYYTIVNKIDYAQELIDRCSGHPEVILALMEIQDKFQLLSLHMELKNTYSNAPLFMLTDNQKDEGTTPIELYSPLGNAVFSVSEIPDMRSYIPFISFWRETDGSPTDNLLINKFLFLLYKALPYPYKRRSIENAIVESWSDIMQRIFLKNSDKNDAEKDRIHFERNSTLDIYQITMRLLMASLIGVYEHCKVRLKFSQRRKLYKWFCMARPNQETFSLWLLRYKEVALCVYREYMFYMISHSGGLYEYLCETTHWELLKSITYDAMDSMRLNINNSIGRHMEFFNINSSGTDNYWNDLDSMMSIYNSRYTEYTNCHLDKGYYDWYPGVPWLYQVQKSLDLTNKSILKCTNRPKTESFQKMVLIKMMEVESKMKKGKINRDTMDPDYVSQTLKEMIKECVSSSDQYDLTPYQILGDEPFNVDPRWIRDMQIAEYIYEVDEGSVATKHVVADMYTHCPYDYQLFKTFFMELGRRKGMAVYYTSETVFRKQIETSNRVYGTAPGEELDPNAGLYYLCPNCNGIKIIVRDVSSLNNPDSIGGWTSDGVCVCLDDYKFTCSYLNSKDTPKRRDPTRSILKRISKPREKGIDIDSLNVKRLMDLGDVRSIRRHCSDKDKEILDKYIYKRREFDTCAETELIPIRLQGRLIKLNNKMVMLCPQCLHPVYFSREMFRNGVEEMSCGCNNLISEFKLECYVCGEECSDYSVPKMVLDDRTTQGEHCGKVHYVALCHDHRSSWTLELSQMPLVSQLESKAKFDRIKMSENGLLRSSDKTRGKRKRTTSKERRSKKRHKSATRMYTDIKEKIKIKSEEELAEIEASSTLYRQSMHSNFLEIKRKAKPEQTTYDITKSTPYFGGLE